MGDRGGCATGPYRTPTALGHSTKTGSYRSSTKYIKNKNKKPTGRLPKCKDKEHGPNERTEQNSRKRLNKMATSKLLDTEFKTLVVRMLKELSEVLSSLKKIQSETKYTLIKIKNNLQGNNSRVDEAEDQIDDMEHK